MANHRNTVSDEGAEQILVRAEQNLAALVGLRMYRIRGDGAKFYEPA